MVTAFTPASPLRDPDFVTGAIDSVCTHNESIKSCINKGLRMDPADDIADREDV